MLSLRTQNTRWSMGPSRDPKSGYLVEEGAPSLLAGIGSVLTNPSLTCDLSGGRTSLRRLSQRTEPLKPLKNLKNLTGWVIG